MASPSSPWPRRLAGALGLVVFALVLARTLRRAEPVHNWDMLGTMALALEWSEPDPLAVHRLTYEAARAELPPETFQDLVAPGVRQERLRDPAAFQEHLPFYRARVLYTGLVALVHAAGVPLVAAVDAVSLASFALLALLLLAWLGRHLEPWLSVPLALALAHAPPLLDTALYQTADALAALIVLFAIYLVLEQRSFAGGGACLLLSILVRPDSIVLAVLWSAALCLLPRAARPSRRALALGLGLCLAAYVGVQRFAGEYGWWPLFRISFVEKAVHPSALPTAIDLGLYREVLARQAAELPGDGYFTIEERVTGSTLLFPYAGLALAGIALAWTHRRRAADGARLANAVALLVVLLLCLPLRWVLFPQLGDRFLIVYYAAVPPVLLALALRALEARVAPPVTAPPTPGPPPAPPA